MHCWYHITLCTRARAATEPTRLKESVDGVGGVGGGAAAVEAASTGFSVAFQRSHEFSYYSHMGCRFNSKLARGYK